MLPVDRDRFFALAEREPRLLELYNEVRAIAASPEAQSPTFCANTTWSSTRRGRGLKARMARLVGWGREGGRDAVLGTREAYEVAYGWLYAALPGCGPKCICSAVLAAATGVPDDPETAAGRVREQIGRYDGVHFDFNGRDDVALYVLLYDLYAFAQVNGLDIDSLLKEARADYEAAYGEAPGP